MASKRRAKQEVYNNALGIDEETSTKIRLFLREKVTLGSQILDIKISTAVGRANKATLIQTVKDKYNDKFTCKNDEQRTLGIEGLIMMAVQCVRDKQSRKRRKLNKKGQAAIEYAESESTSETDTVTTVQSSATLLPTSPAPQPDATGNANNSSVDNSSVDSALSSLRITPQAVPATAPSSPPQQTLGAIGPRPQAISTAITSRTPQQTPSVLRPRPQIISTTTTSRAPQPTPSVLGPRSGFFSATAGQYSTSEHVRLPLTPSGSRTIALPSTGTRSRPMAPPVTTNAASSSTSASNAMASQQAQQPEQPQQPTQSTIDFPPKTTGPFDIEIFKGMHFIGRYEGQVIVESDANLRAFRASLWEDFGYNEETEDLVLIGHGRTFTILDSEMIRALYAVNTNPTRLIVLLIVPRED